MKGRPLQYDMEKVVDEAQDVFWKKGYVAASLHDLKVATKLGSGSFYNTFKGGKKELFKLALHERRSDFEAFKAKLASSHNPLELIKSFFLSIANDPMELHKMGCIISNTVTELSFIDPEIEKEAIQILQEVEEMFCYAIAAAQKNDQIKNQTDPKILGRYLITFWNGLNVTRRIYPFKMELRELIKFQLSILS